MRAGHFTLFCDNKPQTIHGIFRPVQESMLSSTVIFILFIMYSPIYFYFYRNSGRWWLDSDRSGRQILSRWRRGSSRWRRATVSSRRTRSGRLGRIRRVVPTDRPFGIQWWMTRQPWVNTWAEARRYWVRRLAVVERWRSEAMPASVLWDRNAFIRKLCGNYYQIETGGASRRWMIKSL